MSAINIHPPAFTGCSVTESDLASIRRIISGTETDQIVKDVVTPVTSPATTYLTSEHSNSNILIDLSSGDNRFEITPTYGAEYYFTVIKAGSDHTEIVATTSATYNLKVMTGIASFLLSGSDGVIINNASDLNTAICDTFKIFIDGNSSDGYTFFIESVVHRVGSIILL